MNFAFIKQIICLIALVSVVAAVPQWHKASDGSSYLIELERKYNWFDAWNECARQQLQLAVFNTKLKNDLLVELLQKDLVKPYDIWFGGHDDLNTNITARLFYWMPTGEALSYTYWLPGQPNSVTQNCLHIDADSTIYEWNDMSCNRLYGYICENHNVLKKTQADQQLKRADVNKLNFQLLTYYSQQQQQIKILNTKTDFKIKQILFYLKKQLEELQIEANEKIKEAHQQRRQSIEHLAENFSQNLQTNKQKVEEILDF